MHIETCVTGPFEENCYLIWDDRKQAIIIDPGHGAEHIATVARHNSLNIAAYVCTHGHCDHIGALDILYRSFPAPVAIHSADLKWAFDVNNQIEPYYPVPPRPQNTVFLLLEQSCDWAFGDLWFTCMETPGHTPGSCCLYFAASELLFTGDTLFKGSCGRTDLPGGNARHLRDSLNRIKLLPDEVRVFPGHGPETTIGHEKRTNYFMQ